VLKDGFVVLARYRGEPVAGAVFLMSGKHAIFKYGASLAAHQEVRANNLMMWESIKRLARHGYENLDLGRTSLANEGLRRFKLGWGTKEHRIEYVRCDVREGGFCTARDAASGWHNRLFRLLPVTLSRLTGSMLYKHMG
jgi:hypothetical protein